MMESIKSSKEDTTILTRLLTLTTTLYGLLNDSSDNISETTTDLSSELLPIKANFPKMNIMENDNSFGIAIAIAGFSKDDIVIEIENNILTIKSDGVSKKDIKWKNYLLREVTSKPFKRSIRFPVKVSSESIVCNLKNGLLNIHVEKELQKKENLKRVVVNDLTPYG